MFKKVEIIKMNIDLQILEKANSWLVGNFDEKTKEAVNDLIHNNPTELTDAFYRDLEFGTGGLRGIMGVGTNRMNKYTVGMATQGLANYLKMMFSDTHPIKMAISFDSRNNSRYFARITAEVLSANRFLVYLFDDLRPTPELSFTIRHFGCQSGVMITASHNPKEYNGYKAYWNDGAQFIAPHDTNVIKEVQKITSIDEVKWEGINANIITIGKEIDDLYLHEVLSLSLSPEAVKNQKDLKIVYTPLHGAGRHLVPEILRQFGFRNVFVVKEQATADGEFPTVKSPNPEEHSALDLAINKAEEIHADLIMATDPDADRVGIAIRNSNDEIILLNGNQTASLLFYYMLLRWKELGKLNGNQYTVSTIVTTDLLRKITSSFGVTYYSVLTGFKFIAHIVKRNEGRMEYIIGGEESYGLMIGDFVRDKDAVSACAIIAECASWMADKGKTIFDLLLEIYLKYGIYKEQLISVVRKGKRGAEEIQEMMVEYRNNPPISINNSTVIRIKDYLSLKDKDLLAGTETGIDLPSSNVLQFVLEDGSIISIRPSGTEPKIKFYFGVHEPLDDVSGYYLTDHNLNEKISKIITSMKLL